ncbi:MAG: hypothetical protein ACJA1R_003081 [Flavobacteriales bacterium]|jgi:hypothetical protein
MTKQPLTRRSFLERAAVLSAAGAGAGLILAGCNSGGGGGALSCTDTAGLAEADAATRTAMAYVDASANAAQNCLNCQLYVPAAEGECGGCTVVKGNINPAGWCTVWAAKVA